MLPYPRARPPFVSWNQGRGCQVEAGATEETETVLEMLLITTTKKKHLASPVLLVSNLLNASPLLRS